MFDRDDFLDEYLEYKICCEDHSDGGKSSDGCYIATAVYGSYDCPEVWVLRRFRDYGLRKSSVGSLVVRGYYAVSPGVVKRFGHIVSLKRLVKSVLDVFVRFLKKRGFEDTAYYER